MPPPIRSFTSALVRNITGLVVAMGVLVLAFMLWQAVSSTQEAAERDLSRALDRSVERLRMLVQAAEMTADSTERIAKEPPVTGASLRSALERSLAAFEQRPELSYLGIALSRHGEYGTLERARDGQVLLWLHPGVRPDAPPTRSFLLTTQGFVPHAQQASKGYDPRERPFYTAALENPAQGRWMPAYPWVVHTDAQAGLWGLSYVRALRDQAGHLLGVLDIDLDLPAFNRFLAGVAADYALQLQVVELGPTPRLIGDPHVSAAPRPLPDELASLTQQRVPHTVSRRTSLDGVQRAAARRVELPGGVQWVVVATRTATLIEAPLRNQLYQVAGLTMALVFGLALISARLAHRFSRPLAALERSVGRAGQAGAPDALVIDPVPNDFRETRRLGEALNRMASAVGQREEQLARQNVELLEAKEQQVASLALKGAIFESAETGIFSLDHALRIIEWNRATERLFGVARHLALGRPVADLVQPTTGPLDWQALLASPDACTCALVGAHGEFDAELRAVTVPQHGLPVHTLVLHDVSARQRAERHLRHLATHDALTDLPNRHLLQDRLGQAIAHAQRSGKPQALLLLDLDRFKVINEAYGHAFGDAVLKTVGARLVALLRASDTVARHGGDQFLILLTDLQHADDAGTAAHKIVEAMRQPVTLLGRELHLSASVGLSVCPADGTDAESLIKHADQAMYRAKSLGRNTFAGFTAEMDSAAQRRVLLETHLRGAAAAGQLRLVYQPKVDLRTGAIVGCEALLRWSHPTLGEVSPADFIPVAEDCGLIVPISDWVLRTACLQAKAWADADLPRITVAVNISARQLLQQDLVAWTLDMLRETGLPPQLLELELTESLIAQDVERMIATFAQLKAVGVQLSIDDFGTGYSSLSYLKNFRVDTLKIDQSFVRNMLTHAEDETIVRAVIALAHSLRFKVIAEGVETDAHCRVLGEHQCDEIQGYVFSKPVPAPAFEQLLRSGRRLQFASAAEAR